jgi:hypothetical protein
LSRYWNCFKVKIGRRKDEKNYDRKDKEEHVTNKGKMCRSENLSNK